MATDLDQIAPGPDQIEALGMTTGPDQVEASGMTTGPDQVEALDMTTGPDQVEALGGVETFDECLLPQPTASFLHILQTQRSGIHGRALPPAWRPVQLALARSLSLPVQPGQDPREPYTEIVDGLPHRYNRRLKKLLMVLYYHQVQELVGEMYSAGADTQKQKDILRKLAEPLQRYTEAVDAAGAHPFESDLIRRSLYKLFDLPFLTTGEGHLGDSRVQSHNPLKVVLHYIGRCIRGIGFESIIYGAIDIFARQVIASAGGIILIVPVILMSFIGGENDRLIIMCCFVLGFAFLIGICTRATNQEVLAATAVYTAVLVLFVSDASPP